MKLANRDPIYIQNIRRGESRLSAANTAKDGTGTIVTLFSATTAVNGGIGSLIERIMAVATATTTAGMLRLFISDNTGSANWRLILEVPVQAFTASAILAGWNTGNLKADTASTDASIRSAWIDTNIRLEPGQALGVVTNNAEAFEVHAEGGDY